VSGGVGYFYFIIKGKITLSFASPEKENLYIYIYDVITWKKKAKSFSNYYSHETVRWATEDSISQCPFLQMTYTTENPQMALTCPEHAHATDRPATDDESSSPPSVFRGPAPPQKIKSQIE
jgi:hypothetical protein